MIGLAFGAEDYLTDLDGLHKDAGSSILTARSMIVMAARSLKLEAIDTPYLAVHNTEGFYDDVAFLGSWDFQEGYFFTQIKLKCLMMCSSFRR